MNAFVIDAFEFCRVNERLEGEIAVADLPRLAEESVDQAGSIRWSLQGGKNDLGHPQLLLRISGSVRLMCQRCLHPFEYGIQSESVLVLAQDDVSADGIETLMADTDVDVIVGSKSFNVAALIEDEALLAIPLSPKHETCPDQLRLEPAREVEKVSPFAALKDLKQPKQ